MRRLRSGTPPRPRMLLDAVLALAILGLLALVAARLDSRTEVEADGRAAVNDGDTLTLGGARIRLAGIDAPEYHQICRRDEQPYPCGCQSRLALVALIAGRPVVCSGAEHDRYGRLLARCRAGEDDLNRRQVSGGWALAYGGYDDAEAEARAARRGLWAGTFDSPRHRRDTHAGPPAEAAPAAQARAAGWLDLVAGWLSELLGFRSPASSGTTAAGKEVQP